MSRQGACCSRSSASSACTILLIILVGAPWRWCQHRRYSLRTLMMLQTKNFRSQCRFKGGKKRTGHGTGHGGQGRGRGQLSHPGAKGKKDGRSSKEEAGYASSSSTPKRARVNFARLYQCFTFLLFLVLLNMGAKACLMLIFAGSKRSTNPVPETESNLSYVKLWDEEEEEGIVNLPMMGDEEPVITKDLLQPRRTYLGISTRRGNKQTQPL